MLALPLLFAAGIPGARGASPGVEAPLLRAEAAGGPSIVVDGRLDEAAWQRARVVTDFRRYQPSPGGPHDSRTELRILQDADHLYVGVRVTGADYAVRSHVSPREDINVDDQVGVYLDPFGDGRTGYIFYVNPAGIQQDIRYAHGSWYFSWNTVWHSEGRITEDGYEIELAFPFRSLSYPAVTGPRGQRRQDWGVMVTRKIPSEGIKLSWPQLQPGHPRMFVQAATLRNLRPPAAGARVELAPVLAMSTGFDRGESGDGPLRWEGLPEDSPGDWLDHVRPGLDLRAALSPDIGVAATLNPDFSQVEGDVLQVDLNQRFAFFYPEQRPFFLAGIDAFEDGNGTLYTRSIAAPVYGAKLTGQTADFAVGVLQALDRSPPPSVHELGTPGFSEEELEGRQAMNAVARLRRRVGDNGYLGLAAADRRVVSVAPDSAHPTRAFNDVIGVDASLPFREVWVAAGHAGLSVAGHPGDSLVGWREGLSVVRQPGIGTGGVLSISDLSADYRNEMGFVTRSGITSGEAGLNHTVALGDGASTATSGVRGTATRERDGDRFDGLALNQGFNVAGNHQPAAWGELRRWRQDGVELPGWELGTGYDALLSRALSLSVEAVHGRVLDFDTLDPARVTAGDLGLELRPTVNIRMDLACARQWLLPRTGGETAIQQASRLHGRVNWQLTRELGLRTIVQTFTSTEVEDPPVQPSVLLTWLEHPGTEAYLGATWTVETDGRGLTEQQLFFKISKLFRL